MTKDAKLPVRWYDILDNTRLFNLIILSIIDEWIINWFLIVNDENLSEQKELVINSVILQVLSVQ